MLSPANADLVRRDSRLPGLAILLDVEEFLKALNASAPATELRSAHLRYLRYKPGQNCLAAYTLDVNGERVDCHAKAYRAADAVKLAKANLRPTSAGALRRGRFVWPSSRVEVCVFPNDNKVKSLPLIADVARREDFLRKYLPDHPALWRSSFRTLAYKPERRWVGALAVDGKPQAVCKLYGSMAIDTLRSKSGAVSPGDVLRVAPLLRQFRSRALFLGWQEGRMLSEALIERDFNSAALTRVGVALAELHRQDLATIPTMLREAEAASLLALGNLLAFLLPGSAPRIMRAADTLARSVSELPQQEAAIHGDFHAGQVLLNDGGVTLLDFDEAGRGDPLSDLGTFLAHIERDVIYGRFTVTRGNEILAALLEGYQGVAGEPDLRKLGLQVAARLFARLADFFRTCSPDWPVLTVAGLVRVESLLDARSTSRSGASNLSAKSVADENLPALSRALDAVEVRPLLESALRELDPDIALVRVRNVQLRRHKPGRRALIEYELESFGSGGFRERLVALGKMRARGVDEQNLEKLEALSHAGFSPASPDGISIPEQVGVVRELGLWLQRKVSGQPAAELLTRPAGVAVARRAADAAHKLHCSRLSLERTHTPADEIALLRPRLAAAAELRPARRERIIGVADACARLAGELPWVLPRAIHRDFYHDQLLVAGDRVWLVDLDLLCAGDPALDAGNFIGHLIEWSLRSPGDHPALEAAAESFADRFLELTGADAQERVAIWTTLTLARHVFISTQFPDRAPFTETILERCEKHCDLARTAPRVAAFSTAPI